MLLSLLPLLMNWVCFPFFPIGPYRGPISSQILYQAQEVLTPKEKLEAVALAALKGREQSAERRKLQQDSAHRDRLRANSRNLIFTNMSNDENTENYIETVRDQAAEDDRRFENTLLHAAGMPQLPPYIRRVLPQREQHAFLQALQEEEDEEHQEEDKMSMKIRSQQQQQRHPVRGIRPHLPFNSRTHHASCRLMKFQRLRALAYQLQLDTTMLSHTPTMVSLLSRQQQQHPLAESGLNSMMMTRRNPWTKTPNPGRNGAWLQRPQRPT